MASNVTTVLRQALTALESEQRRVDRQIAAIRGVLGDGLAPRTATRPRRRKGMSTAARAAVSQRMKAYWAKRRAAKAAAAEKTPKSTVTSSATTQSIAKKRSAKRRARKLRTVKAKRTAKKTA